LTREEEEMLGLILSPLMVGACLTIILALLAVASLPAGLALGIKTGQISFVTAGLIGFFGFAHMAGTAYYAFHLHLLL
jgi:preprotein translocase subunit Sec61beta